MRAGGCTGRGKRPDPDRVRVEVGVVERSAHRVGPVGALDAALEQRLILPDGLGLGLAGSGSWSGEVEECGLPHARFVEGPVPLGFLGCDGVLRVLVDAEIKRKKGIWWMPWRLEAMKDVARCEKPRGDASNR